MMTEQVFAKALLITGELEVRQQELLWILCEAGASTLAARLRDGLTPEDCQESFVTAASLYAAASLGGSDQVSEFKAGDLTVKTKDTQGLEQTADILRRQADGLMAPYLKDRFLFAGV